jgi:hypothetical protein
VEDASNKYAPFVKFANNTFHVTLLHATGARTQTGHELVIDVSVYSLDAALLSSVLYKKVAVTGRIIPVTKVVAEPTVDEEEKLVIVPKYGGIDFDGRPSFSASRLSMEPFDRNAAEVDTTVESISDDEITISDVIIPRVSQIPEEHLPPAPRIPMPPRPRRTRPGGSTKGYAANQYNKNYKPSDYMMDTAITRSRLGNNQLRFREYRERKPAGKNKGSGSNVPNNNDIENKAQAVRVSKGRVDVSQDLSAGRRGSSLMRDSLPQYRYSGIRDDQAVGSVLMGPLHPRYSDVALGNRSIPLQQQKLENNQPIPSTPASGPTLLQQQRGHQLQASVETYLSMNGLEAVEKAPLADRYIYLSSDSPTLRIMQEQEAIRDDNEPESNRFDVGTRAGRNTDVDSNHDLGYIVIENPSNIQEDGLLDRHEEDNVSAGRVEHMRMTAVATELSSLKAGASSTTPYMSSPRETRIRQINEQLQRIQSKTSTMTAF